ncbi:MAG: GxxExxY protein [Candidatus Omnitrophota bacterium]|nr:GxxExxY protein [Candidatus Omnitrophota bacterium]
MQTDIAKMQTDKLLFRELTYKIIGICYRIHTSLGCGFPEKVYQKALEIEFHKEGITYETEKAFRVLYNKEAIGRFRLDMVIDGKVVIELKAVERLPNVFREQIISQLKASPYEVGLLVNFGSSKLEYLRIARSKPIRLHPCLRQAGVIIRLNLL